MTEPASGVRLRTADAVVRGHRLRARLPVVPGVRRPRAARLAPPGGTRAPTSSSWFPPSRRSPSSRASPAPIAGLDARRDAPSPPTAASSAVRRICTYARDRSTIETTGPVPTSTSPSRTTRSVAAVDPCPARRLSVSAGFRGPIGDLLFWSGAMERWRIHTAACHGLTAEALQPLVELAATSGFPPYRLLPGELARALGAGVAARSRPRRRQQQARTDRRRDRRDDVLRARGHRVRPRRGRLRAPAGAPSDGGHTRCTHPRQAERRGPLARNRRVRLLGAVARDVHGPGYVAEWQLHGPIGKESCRNGTRSAARRDLGPARCRSVLRPRARSSPRGRRSRLPGHGVTAPPAHRRRGTRLAQVARPRRRVGRTGTVRAPRRRPRSSRSSRWSIVAGASSVARRGVGTRQPAAQWRLLGPVEWRHG